MRMSGSAATSDAVRLASYSVCAERPAQDKMLDRLVPLCLLLKRL